MAMEHPKSDSLEEARDDNPHLERHLEAWKERSERVPEFVPTLPRDAEDRDEVDMIYPVGDPIFVHVYGEPDKEVKYHAVEPELTADEREKYEEIRERILALAPYEEPPMNPEELRETLFDLYDRVTTAASAGNHQNGAGLITKLQDTLDPTETSVPLGPVEARKIKYYLERDIVEHGPIEPLIRDPYPEDIHGIGLENIHHIHEVFGMMETNVSFKSMQELDEFLRNMGERMGQPVSESNPVVDASLPDGSRINIMYSDDVSLKGSSFTIRKFQETPLSMTQIVKWGTLSAQMAAYLWICLEYGQSIFVCGETASGKTTTLNSSLPFIQPEKKIYSAEDTPEVQPPQPSWQQLKTREQGPEESRVDMFDLLEAALRSRPEYIVVGEIRGAEGNVAFQAMQTGHPVLSTFHASSVQKMIQRLSSPPINVPERFMDNLNVALIQMAVYHEGEMLRRVLGIQEIEGYSEYQDGVVTRGVFNWDPKTDSFNFRGRNNSYVLEERIAQVAGFTDTRKIYDVLDQRTQIIEKMIENDIMHYDDVKEVIWDFYREGIQGLPFTL